MIGDKDIDYEMYVDEEWNAGSNSLEEIMHYAMQYAEDGKVTIYRVTRELISIVEMAP